jgi:type II secretory pathway pseudopilin PulG
MAMRSMLASMSILGVVALAGMIVYRRQSRRAGRSA